ncbi:hypothetical protein HY029_00610 [Candidatus Gottesmanbacteria bacterium]|nr:hypothetical protein [Candidatus Gottesmanbacteria bacterium]
MSDLLKIAISAALSQDWQKAIKTNQQLLVGNKNDINCLSRLAHAYAQSGKLNDAKKIYKKILALDKYNIIALKNIDKLNALPKSGKLNVQHPTAKYPLSPSQFLEEPGKTKTVNLINTAPASILSNLNPADPVILFPKKHTIEVRSINKVYLGALPDDCSFRILRFLKAGYEYVIFVKNASKNSVSIFIREVKRAKRFKSQPSFLTSMPSQLRNILRDNKNLDTDDEDSEENPNDQEGLDEE